MLENLKQGLSGLELVPSGGGCFEVFVDDRRIYSKLATGVFPDFQEMLRQVEAKVA